MFDKRPLLFGLGIGIIAGALLLQLMLVGEREYAELDRIDKINGEDTLYTQSELDERIAEAEERIRQELQHTASESDELEADQQEAEEPPAAADDESVDGTADVPAAEPAKMIVDKLPVRVKPGMTLTQIASLLKSKGIIEDEKILLALMADISGEITAGFYFFDGELSPADVKVILTSPPFAY